MRGRKLTIKKKLKVAVFFLPVAVFLMTLQWTADFVWWLNREVQYFNNKWNKL